MLRIEVMIALYPRQAWGWVVGLSGFGSISPVIHLLGYRQGILSLLQINKTRHMAGLFIFI
jgi:hypothetical protein